MTLKRTALHAAHQEAGAKLVPFAGWEMPLNYGSQVAEHHAVRQNVGMFDVSHMGIADLEGPAALAFLRRLMANDVGRLRHPGRAIYTCMLNEAGGVLDDLIVYRLGEDLYRVVLNAARNDADLASIGAAAEGANLTLTPRTDLGLLALQGPNAAAMLKRVLPLCEPALTAMKPFDIIQFGDEAWAARTGYTGEDGWEFMLGSERLQNLWRELREQGVAPCGLGARDTLRLEAGLNLYGQDMTETVTPYECGLGWTVAMEPIERDFIGRAALEAAAKPATRFTGLLLEERGVLRAGQALDTPLGAGLVTSGGFSPTLGASIGLGRVPLATGDTCQVELRGNILPVRCVKLPFVRHGKILVQ